MNNWGKFNETTLLEKEEFYNGLKVEEITDADYMHGKLLLNSQTIWMTFMKILKNTFQIKNKY